MKNRKIFRIFVVALALMLSVVALVSCGDSDKNNTKQLVSVDIIELPEEGIYAGKFDDANIKALLTYDDGSTERIGLSKEDVPENYRTLLTIPGEHTIDMLYRGFQISFTIKVKSCECKVTFVNLNDEVVKSITYNFVDRTPAIIPPSEKEMYVEGYRFTGEFDKDFDHVTKDTVVKGIYVETSVVRFYNNKNEVVDVQYVDMGDAAIAPSFSEMAVTGYRFTGEFDKSLQNITEDTDIKGKYVKTYNVTFFNGYNEIISRQVVDVGCDAVEPSGEDKAIPDYIWTAWDGTFTNVRKDLEIYGIYVRGYTLTYNSEDETKGIICGNFESGELVPIGGSISLGALTIDPRYEFAGWYVNDELVSTDTVYDFLMLSNPITLIAKFQHICHAGHDNTEYAAKDPTCTEIGWDAYTVCSRCGENTYVEKPIIGHDFVSYGAKEPSCTDIGWDAYSICRNCGESTYVEKSPVGHNKEWIVEMDPTCTESGIRAHQCTRCHLEFERVIIEPLSHEMYDNECTRCHKHLFVITVNYMYANGDIAASAVTTEVWENNEYSIASPELEGYIADSTLISGVATNNVTYTVTYTVIELEKITRIIPITIGSVEYNTAFSDLGLPSTVVAVTNAGRELNLAVYWNESTYSKNTFGNQRIKGTVVAGYGYVLACENLAVASVDVSQNVITQINPMNLGRLPLGTSYAGLGLPTTASVTTSTGAIYYLPVVWNTYNYNSSVEGSHVINGTVSLLEGFTFDDGVSNTATITFTLSEAMYGTADIIFIVDTTGSMYNEIQNVRRNINAFAERLEQEGVSVRWALLEYRDITCDGIESTKVIYCGASEWFIDVTSYERAIAELNVAGGGDGPETVIDALMAATLLESREDAKTFHIVVTDADYKNNNQYNISGMAEMIANLTSKDITASVVTKSSYYNIYRTLTDTTNGILANIDGNFADELWRLCDLIIDDVVYGSVESINIIRNPDKTSYESGDYFNGNGMIVEATYATGRTKIVTVYSVMPCGALQITDTQIEINYRGKVAYIPITVTNTVIPVIGINVSNTDLILEVDEIFTVTAEVVPNNATNKSVVWSTANSNVAVVVNGKITAVGVGTTSITVSTLDGLHSTSINVTVTEKFVAVENVVTSIGAVQLAPDSPYTVVATVYPLEATNKNLIWSSSNPDVATVENGVIFAHAEGNATIIVTSEDGSHSAKIYVVVKLETCSVDGRVISPSGSGLAGVTVKAYRFGTLVSETMTDSSGNYTFESLVYGDYEFTYEKSTYLSSSYTAVLNNTNYIVENITMVVDGDYHGTVIGYATDSTNNNPIKDITINVRVGSNNTTGDVIATLTTDSNGYYTTTLPTGYYTFEFVDERGLAKTYTSVSYNVSIAGNSTVTCSASLSGGISDFTTMRIILKWGSSPSDLDSHLLIDTASSNYHIYYSNKTPYGANANLDVDDTSSYGPETTTILDFFEKGIYTYTVHNYTNRNSYNSTSLSYSGATVEVYFGDTLYGTYHVPAGAGTCWNVFTYNAYTGEFTLNNAITNSIG